jgi:hypothetical protein
MDIRIQRLPPSIRRLPLAQRREALQRIANHALHSRNICPIGQFVAGNIEVTVGIYRHTEGGYWYVSNNFPGAREEEYAAIVAAEIAHTQ